MELATTAKEPITAANINFFTVVPPSLNLQPLR